MSFRSGDIFLPVEVQLHVFFLMFQCSILSPRNLVIVLKIASRWTVIAYVILVWVYSVQDQRKRSMQLRGKSADCAIFAWYKFGWSSYRFWWWNSWISSVGQTIAFWQICSQLGTLQSLSRWIELLAFLRGCFLTNRHVLLEGGWYKGTTTEWARFQLHFSRLLKHTVVYCEKREKVLIVELISNGIFLVAYVQKVISFGASILGLSVFLWENIRLKW